MVSLRMRMRQPFLRIRWAWQRRCKARNIERRLAGKGDWMMGEYDKAYMKFLEEDRKDKPSFTILETCKARMEVIKWLIG